MDLAVIGLGSPGVAQGRRREGVKRRNLKHEYPECEACYYESLGFMDHQQGWRMQGTSSRNQMRIHLLDDT